VSETLWKGGGAVDDSSAERWTRLGRDRVARTMGGGKSAWRIRGVAAQGWNCTLAGRVGRGWRRDSTESGQEERLARV
jgi:hypothetical protein